jgi:hypothetical protein
VWRGTAGVGTRLFDRATATWGLLELLPGSAEGRLPQVVGRAMGIDDEGNALVTWLARQPGGADHAMVTRLTRTGSSPGWSAPLSLHPAPPGNADYPAVAAGPKGHMVAAWQQHQGSGDWQIWARVYQPGAGWQEPVPLGWVRGSGPHNDPRLTVDADGTAAVVWVANDLSLRRFHADHGWSELLQVPQSTGAQRPHVLLGPQCQVHVIWERAGAQVEDTLSARLRP